MNEQITKIYKNISEFWAKLSAKTKKLMIGGLIGLIAGALAITFILNNKGYVVLFNDIDQSETAEVMKQLQDNKVDYKYQSDGTILIPEDQESSLRMKLAESGHPRTGSNYDLFTNSIDFMTTDYEKKVYEIYQLQERLQSSIKTIDGVEESIVTITVPKEKSFAWESDQEEASASVKVNLVSGKTLTASQTNGIMQLVCKSVQGLKEENVVIIDTDGNSLSMNQDMFQTNSIKLKLEIEREFEKETEGSVGKFLATMYGPDNVQVSAKCTINFDKKMSETLQYIPEEDTKTGIPSESQSEREVTGPGKSAGGVVGAESNAEVPTYPGVTIEGDNIYYKDTNAINYLVSQLKEQIEHNPGNIENLTVAVVINKSKMTEEEITNVKDLVAFSAGVDTSKVALHNMAFYDPDAPPVVATNPLEVVPNITKKVLIYGGIGLGALAVLIFIISILFIKRKNKKSKQMTNSGDKNEGDKEDFSWQDIHDEIKLQDTKEQVIKKQLKDFTSNNPEIAAQLIRTWIKGDDD